MIASAIKAFTNAIGIKPCAACNKRAEKLDYYERTFIEMITSPTKTTLPSQETVFYAINGNFVVNKAAIAETRSIRIARYLVDPAGQIAPIKLGDDVQTILMPPTKDDAMTEKIAKFNAGLDALVREFLG